MFFQFSVMKVTDFLEESGTVGELKVQFLKINKVRSQLVLKYNEQFISTLVDQAIDKRDRYRPVKHHRVNVGDLILLKDEHLKPYHYPIAVVRKVYENEIGEVTNVEAFKGKTRELVKRHTSVVPYLALKPDSEAIPNISPANTAAVLEKPKRQAAIRAGLKTKALFDKDLL